MVNRTELTMDLHFGNGNGGIMHSGKGIWNMGTELVGAQSIVGGKGHGMALHGWHEGHT